jgi:hypothetical protein
VIENGNSSVVAALAASNIPLTRVVSVYDDQPLLAGRLFYGALFQLGSTLHVLIFDPSAATDTVGVAANMHDASTGRDLITFTSPRLSVGQVWEKTFDMSLLTNGTRLYLTNAAGTEISSVLSWGNIDSSSISFSRFYVGNFYVPRAGNVTLGFVIDSNTPTRPILITTNHGSTYYLMKKDGDLYEGPTMQVEEGALNINFTTPIDSTLQSVILLPNPSSYDTSPPLSPSLSVLSSTSSKYAVRVVSNASFFLTLGQSFSDSWHAHIGGQELPHFVTYSVANGFYVSQSGTHEIVIEYNNGVYSDVVLAGVSILGASILFPFISYFFSSPRTLSNKLRNIRDLIAKHSLRS